MTLCFFLETFEVQITDKRYRYTNEGKQEDGNLYICMPPFVICTSSASNEQTSHLQTKRIDIARVQLLHMHAIHVLCRQGRKLKRGA